VSRATKREVHERDGSQCTFVSADGERCPARELLELDHREARAHGGKGDASNIRLLCRTHNQYEAEQLFGRDFMAAKIRQRKARTSKMRETPVAARVSSTPPWTSRVP